MSTDATIDEYDPEDGEDARPSRSGFLFVGLAGLCAALGAFYFASTYRYMQTDPHKNRHLRVALKGLHFDHGVAGPIDYDANDQIYLTRNGGTWVALERTCPHQGCPVDWHGVDGLFVCPCHGSEYNRLGGVVQGPSARGLYHHRVRAEPDALVLDGRSDG